jgi:RND family efflux transporter MFP subunit
LARHLWHRNQLTGHRRLHALGATAIAVNWPAILVRLIREPHAARSVPPNDAATHRAAGDTGARHAKRQLPTMRHRLLPAVAVLAVALHATNSQAQQPAPIPVLVTIAHFAPLVAERTLPGVIRARTESDLGFRVGGKLIRRPVDAGQVVRAGEVLAELDPADLAHQVQMAEAELRAAQSARAVTAAELQRIATLRRTGWSTPADHDRQRTLADDAQGRLSRAEQALALARNALTYGTLTADAPAVVTAALAEPGQVVAAGQTVLRVARLDQKEAAVAVPEAAIEQARTGSPRVVLWALPDRDYPASLRELSPNADPVTRTYAARFALPSAGPEVMLGMTATVRLTLPAPQVVRLPLSAILDDGNGPTVWVLDASGSGVSRRPVQIAGLGADSVTVMSGVSEGERVVALGVQKLDPASRVRVVPEFAP